MDQELCGEAQAQTALIAQHRQLFPRQYGESMKLFKCICAIALLLLGFILPMQSNAQLYQISLMLDDGATEVIQTATETSTGVEVPFTFYKDFDGKLVSGKSPYADHPYEEISTKLRLERGDNQLLQVHVDQDVITWGKPLSQGMIGITMPTSRNVVMSASISPEKPLLELYAPRDCNGPEDGPCYKINVIATPVDTGEPRLVRSVKVSETDSLKTESMRYRVYGLLTDGMNMQGELRTDVKENAITEFNFYQAGGQLFTGIPPDGVKASAIISSIKLTRDEKQRLRMVINGEITAVHEGDSKPATSYHYNEKVPLWMDQNPVVARLSKACEKGQPLAPCEMIAAFYVFPVYPDNLMSM